jgi:very-short-patch-repair endonuclease
MSRLNNTIGLKKNRKNLRNNLTPAEARLWTYLQNSELGKKFRRQHSIGFYILDFYCPSRKLGIELDGSPHNTDEGYKNDHIRGEYLKSKGIIVLRFENQEVFKNPDGVLAEIKKYL